MALSYPCVLPNGERLVEIVFRNRAIGVTLESPKEPCSTTLIHISNISQGSDAAASC